ncbi:unnamed protein product [Cuscuta campestris]|uniref:Uncharacterized protein n=1 Tax=Cuscuta campestris TaxID=132261 RepID=A0A484L5A4_9ASTE|nr:unnamed protein product [Cuscuta campestris]
MTPLKSRPKFLQKRPVLPPPAPNLKKGRAPIRVLGGSKKKKTGSLNLEGESIEEAFLALARRLHKAGAILEDVGRSLLESRDQISQLNLLLNSAKLEINDWAEREKRLEEELRAEKAKLEEKRARSAQLEEDGRRKVAKIVELEDGLTQVKESARAKEETFLVDAANWAACQLRDLSSTQSSRGGMLLSIRMP